MNSIESIRKQNTITTLEIAEMMEVRLNYSQVSRHGFA